MTSLPSLVALRVETDSRRLEIIPFDGKVCCKKSQESNLDANDVLDVEQHGHMKPLGIQAPVVSDEARQEEQGKRNGYDEL